MYLNMGTISLTSVPLFDLCLLFFFELFWGTQTLKFLHEELSSTQYPLYCYR